MVPLLPVLLLALILFGAGFALKALWWGCHHRAGGVAPRLRLPGCRRRRTPPLVPMVT
jgi:hypothetical protein